MKTSRRLLPDEWATAMHSLMEMHRAGLAVHPIWSNVLGFAIPFGIGMSLALLLMPELVETDKSVLVGVGAGVLAYCAILIGFGVTLMLFTGRIDRPLDMSYEDLRGYVDRIRYLLASQGLTLFVALGTALVTLVWTVFVAADGPHVAAVIWLGAAASGLTSVCLVRTALLPLQIFELHEAWLRDALDAKEAEIRRRYSSTSKDAD